MKTILPVKYFTFLLPLFLFLATTGISQAPELIFTNPVLVGGIANTQGAVYRFSDVTTGVDAELKLKKFSRNDITMADVDLASLGWDKAFQPQFGIAGNVAPGQKWFIEFEISFLKAGTNTKQKMARFDLTSLDVDGDGVSIAEYVDMETPDSVSYSSVSYLTHGGAGTQEFICSEDNIASPIIICPFCLLGLDLFGHDCIFCDGAGKIYELCHHSFSEGLNIQGPVSNFYNIDTSATQVMATYTYLNRDKIKFKIGATSGTSSSTAGVRLNSMWFRSFSLAPVINILPVTLTAFNAAYNKGSVDLFWETAAEFDFDNFEIERSATGKTFTKISSVTGESSKGSRYNFTDSKVDKNEKILYYRLKMIDMDGSAVYSATRTVKPTAASNKNSITAYPNPVVRELNISIPGSFRSGTTIISLYNLQGSLVKSANATAASAVHTLHMNELAAGFYTLRVSNGTETMQSKIIKN